jgi:diguanylate cyclase (GGDEF)-like protein
VGTPQLSASNSLDAIQRLLDGVCQAAADAASEVNWHQSRVQTLADELAGVGPADSLAVAAVVRKLLHVNAELQQRLERTEKEIESHQRELNATVQAAQTDALTGLANRRVLEARLKRALHEHELGRPPATLFMLDLDHFKSLNDTYGHMTGDAALRHVGEILRRQAGGAQLVARYGGEEFAVLLAGPAAEAAAQAEMLRQAIGQVPFVVEGKSVPLTASGGLAEQLAGDALTQWIERADKALYAAKRSGRNCTFRTCQDGTLELVRPRAATVTQPSPAEEPGEKSLRAAQAELTPEAFADSTFPDQIARRIAEWRRGGATLTVVLARVVTGTNTRQLAAPSPAQMRAVYSIVQRQVRAMDVLTRWQHDGLALLLPGMGGREACRVFSRWLRELPEALPAEDGCDTPWSLRVGIAEGLEGNDARRVLERAWLGVHASLQDPAERVFLHDGVRARPLASPARPAARR